MRRYWIVGAFALICVGFLIWFNNRSEKIFTFVSPSNDLSVELYIKSGSTGLPGSSGQREGFVVLRDMKTERVLRRERTENVAIIDDVWWEDRKVIIRGFDVWDVPD